MKTILVPIDFSPASAAVISTANALARSLKGGVRVVVINVLQPPVLIADYAGFVPDVGALIDASMQASAKRLKQVERQLRCRPVRARSLQLNGFPATEIVAQAKKLRADFIVIGSHGHTAFYDLLVGSTASGVLKRAPCPVVVVPPARNRVVKAKRR